MPCLRLLLAWPPASSFQTEKKGRLPGGDGASFGQVTKKRKINTVGQAEQRSYLGGRAVGGEDTGGSAEGAQWRGTEAPENRETAKSRRAVGGA